MYLKDYYKILEIEPSANQLEIKKAYRKLALQYHPDKNNADPYALANFTEIKEAYEVLTNPAKKDNYLQQRWYNRSMGNTQTHALVTPINILKEVIEFERYTAMLDVFRMDKEQLYQYMNTLLEAEIVDKLVQFKEQAINKQMILTLIKPIKFLTVDKAVLLQDKLIKLAMNDAETVALINKTIALMNQKEQWKKRQWMLILLLTLSICWLIWYAA